MADTFAVEVVYAMPGQQTLLKLNVAAGICVDDLLRLPEVTSQFPQLDLGAMPVGIFGKVVGDRQRVLCEGDRVEIYRPLLADPMEVRRLRAAKAAQDKARSGS